MKKRIGAFAIVAFALLAALCLGACKTQAPGGAGMSYTPGIYTAQAYGHGGAMTIQATFTSDAIASVEVLKHGETAGVGDAAFARISKAVVAGQTLSADTVTGATMTSRAVLSGVEACVKQAGGDPGMLKARKAKAPKPADVEKTADVIVVGGGGAGISAALSALQNGASVIILEKAGYLGGNTMVGGGVWNCYDPERVARMPNEKGRNETLKALLERNESEAGPFAGTFRTLKGQIRAYLAGDTSKLFDSVELHILQSYFGGLRQRLDGSWISGNYDLVNLLCSRSLETQKWLEGFGASFIPPLIEPIGALWLRAHATAGGNYKNYVQIPRAFIEKAGGEILLETTAKELIREGGRVTGVRAVTREGARVTLRARKGVVMATGGFAANPEMVIKYNKYWPKLNPDIKTTNLPMQRGDGIVMGQAVGAAVTGMEFTQLMPIGWADTGELALGKGTDVIFVNTKGRRFVNEYAERDVISMAAIENGELFYEIRCENTWRPTPESRVVFKSDTLEGLAAKIKVDPAALAEEVAKYNRYVDAGADPEHGKNVFEGKIVAPYMARAMKPSLHHTMGGLVIDTSARVLDKDGRPIAGLYAAGEVTGGIHAGNRLGGNAVADVFVFGRIAGASAAKGL